MFYFLLFLLSAFIYYLFDNNGYDCSKRGYFGLSVVVVLLCLVAGLRDLGVGTDTLYYSADYYYNATHYSLKDVWNEKTIGEKLSVAYFLLNQFSVMLYDDIASPLFFTELCILGGILLVYKKFQKIYKFNFFLLLLLYLFLYYNQTLNYMRQLCAVTFTFASYFWYIRKKYKLCVAGLIIGYLFHSSAIGGIIPLVIYRLASVETSKLRTKLSIVYVGILVGAALAFNGILIFLAGNGILLDIYAERYGVGNSFGGDFSTSQLLFLLIGYILIYISHRKKILSEKQNTMVFLLHTTNIVLLLFGLYAFFLFRIAFFVAFPDLLYLTMILSTKKMYGLIKWSYVVMAVLLWLNLYIIHGNCETNPYTSKSLGILK